MKKFIPFLFVSLLLACNKDKFETKPQIEIQSYNTKVVPYQGTLTINLKFTDKEGDLGNGEFTYEPISLNRRPLPPGQEYGPVPLPIPEFTDHNKGEFEVNLRWVDLHKHPIENDTIRFKFSAVDRAGNKSDTIQSDQIVILRQ